MEKQNKPVNYIYIFCAKELIYIKLDAINSFLTTFEFEIVLN